jgi:hypothetical protein
MGWLIAGGSALWHGSSAEDANEALIVAMKIRQFMTATRLALGWMSFEKAKIMRELVRSGVAK